MMESTEDNWMLDELTRIPGVRFCLVVTSDGLKQAHTQIGKDEADTIAAAASGLLALAESVQDHAGFKGPLEQSFSRWADGYLFVRRAGDRTSLAVATTVDIDPGLIARAMADRIKQVGESMNTPALP
jgi:predicted regulator of Ras-like GTPase activity (Roadblock/LC7/MglB family)